MPKVNINKNHIKELLTRSVEDVVPRELAESKFGSGKRLRVYFGIDPTGSKLHLGHAVPLRKLKAFADFGHEVILVVGSFTAMIGDPSGQNTTRESLTKTQVEKNYQTYKKQVAQVINLKNVEVRYNHEWLEKLSFVDTMRLASYFTVQQMLERDMFRERMSWKVVCIHCGYKFNSPIQFGGEGAFKTAVLKGNMAQCEHCGQMTPCNKDNLTPPPNPISPNEFLYPLLVGYDSVVLDVDCEIGGNDQLFNMLAGRKLQKIFGKRDKFVLTTKILEGTDGRKMSKTYNNCIYLTDTANDMYGKVMSIKDELIIPYFEACTNVSADEISLITKALRANENPKKYKEQLASAIVAIYHGVKPSEAAKEEFNNVHRGGKLPEQISQFALPKGKKTMPIIELLVYSKLALSKGEARRLVTQSGVKIDGKVIKNWQEEINLKSGLVAQVGSRKFAKFK
jgi:tyrosyl-tRNA synthetase